MTRLEVIRFTLWASAFQRDHGRLPQTTDVRRKFDVVPAMAKRMARLYADETMRAASEPPPVAVPVKPQMRVRAKASARAMVDVNAAIAPCTHEGAGDFLRIRTDAVVPDARPLSPRL